MKGLAVVLLLVILGCTPQWHREGMTEQQYAADQSECLARGGQASGANDPFGLLRRQAYEGCMKGKGYSL